MYLKPRYCLAFLMTLQANAEPLATGEIAVTADPISESTACGVIVNNDKGPFTFKGESMTGETLAQLRFKGPSGTEKFRIANYELDGFDSHIPSNEIKIQLGPLGYSLSTYMQSTGVNVDTNRNYNIRAIIKNIYIWNESPGNKKITFTAELKC